MAQIMYDAAQQRFGTPAAGVGLMVIIILGVFFCLVATMTYVSRYARSDTASYSEAPSVQLQLRSQKSVALVN